MKTRDIKELQTKTEAELKTMLAEARASLTSARLEHTQRKLTNTSSLTTLRHDMARMQTVLHMKSVNKPSQESTVANAKGEKKTMAAKGGKA